MPVRLKSLFELTMFVPETLWICWRSTSQHSCPGQWYEIAQHYPRNSGTSPQAKIHPSTPINKPPLRSSSPVVFIACALRHRSCSVSIPSPDYVLLPSQSSLVGNSLDSSGRIRHWLATKPLEHEGYFIYIYSQFCFKHPNAWWDEGASTEGILKYSFPCNT